MYIHLQYRYIYLEYIYIYIYIYIYVSSIYIHIYLKYIYIYIYIYQNLPRNYSIAISFQIYTFYTFSYFTEFSKVSKKQKYNITYIYYIYIYIYIYIYTRFAKTLQNSLIKLDILLIQTNNKNKFTLKSRVMNQILTKITFHLVNLLLRQIHTNNFIDLNQVQITAQSYLLRVLKKNFLTPIILEKFETISIKKKNQP